MSIFKDQVAVITGAGSGIGRALAQQLASAGARLAISDIDQAALQETADLLPADAEYRCYTLDVSDREAMFGHASDVERDFGSAHFVFNNAGATVVGTIEHLEIEEIEWLLGINMWGVVYGCKAFLPLMRKQGRGCLINISSVFGFVSFPAQGAYNMSKFAVRGLTECLWQELEGSGIRAVCVHPGGIKTNIERSGRRCRNAGPEESRFEAAAEKMLVTSPEKCAKDILSGIARGKRRIRTGKHSDTLSWLSRLLPDGYPGVLKVIASTS